MRDVLYFGANCTRAGYGRERWGEKRSVRGGGEELQRSEEANCFFPNDGLPINFDEPLGMKINGFSRDAVS